MKIPFTEIKHPVLVAFRDGNHTVWWADKDDDICFFDNIEGNYPQYTVGSFDNKEEAKQRAKEMEEHEGWEIIENRLEDL